MHLFRMRCPNGKVFTFSKEAKNQNVRNSRIVGDGNESDHLLTYGSTEILLDSSVSASYKERRAVGLEVG